MEFDRSGEVSQSLRANKVGVQLGVGAIAAASAVGFVCLLALSSKGKQSLRANKPPVLRSESLKVSYYDRQKSVDIVSTTVWTEVADFCNCFSILCALASGFMWHLSTVGTTSPELLSINATWNSLAALAASASAVLAILSVMASRLARR